ncbi:MAG: inositol monophosphatase family protein, partial [Candidatus Limnocylindrales bacterium]
AGIQMGLYERLESIDFKAEKDVVTVADHRSEEAILEIIGTAFPGDAFLAEESGASGETADRLWVIDPLDGTVNYANGIPFFAVSIGLCVKGEPMLGVVLDPARDELFTAVRGPGAFLDGRRLHNPGRKLSDAVVALGLPSSGFGKQYREIRRRVRITRAMGSATLSLTYCANGRFDAYVQWSKLSVWDICAAGVIALEGGATVTSARGNEWFGVGMPSKSMGIAAATPEHHATILRLLGEG